MQADGFAACVLDTQDQSKLHCSAGTMAAIVQLHAQGHLNTDSAVVARMETKTEQQAYVRAFGAKP